MGGWSMDSGCKTEKKMIYIYANYGREGWEGGVWLGADGASMLMVY